VGDVEKLRNACAASGFHEHDGCSCSDEELIRRASSPPSPPASVEEIARRLADEWFGTDPLPFKVAVLIPRLEATLLSDRAAMAERVAGLERHCITLERQRDEANVYGDEEHARFEAAEAEVARLTDRVAELNMLAHGWMVAHDMRAAGKPVTFPAPVDLPNAIARAEASEAEVTRLREALEPFADYGEFLEAETTGFSDTDKLRLIPEESDVVIGELTIGDFRRAATCRLGGCLPDAPPRLVHRNGIR